MVKILQADGAISSVSTQVTVAGSETSRGSIVFDDLSSGAFQITIAPAILPKEVLIDQDAVRKDTATAAIQLGGDQLPNTAAIVVLGDIAGDIQVSIDGFGVGTIDGTIVANNLASGETAKLAVLAFA